MKIAAKEDVLEGYHLNAPEREGLVPPNWKEFLAWAVENGVRVSREKRYVTDPSVPEETGRKIPDGYFYSAAGDELAWPCWVVVQRYGVVRVLSRDDFDTSFEPLEVNEYPF